MTVLVTRAVAQTIAVLRTRVRDMVGDPATTSAVQRWTNAQIDSALDDMMRQMYNELHADDFSAYKLNLDMAYTANSQSTALDINVSPMSIYYVEDIDDATNPVVIDWIDTMDLNRFQSRAGWSLAGGGIALRPLPQANKQIRIWYVPAFVPLTGAASPTTDQHPMNVNQEELLALGAAIRLQEVDVEIAASRTSRFEHLWEIFKAAADRYRGPVHVKSTRSYR